MSLKRQRKSKKNMRLLFEIYGVLIVSFAVLLFIGIYYKSAGIIGGAVSSVLKGIFGFGTFIIPFFLFAFGM